MKCGIPTLLGFVEQEKGDGSKSPGMLNIYSWFLASLSCSTHSSCSSREL